METLTPLPVREPETREAAPDEASGSLYPFARVGLAMVNEVGRTLMDDVLAPELQQQQPRQRPVHNQQELLAAFEVAMWQTQLDILEAQSPGRLMRGIFGREEQTREDATNLANVRAELGQIAEAQPTPISIEQNVP